MKVGDGAMERTYLVGLVMFCLAFAFTMGLASFLQHVAIARQQAAASMQIEPPMVSMLPPAPTYRKASF
jgi:hypothetical protein